MKAIGVVLLIGLLLMASASLAQSEATAACAGCHGAQGEGNASMNSPRIAGQPAEYLQRQLDAYANGARRSPVMEPIAKALSPPQRRDAAAAYAALESPRPATRSAASERGRRLATVGDDKLQVQACSNCHGPDGIGEPPVPYLAGQHAAYLAAALQQWKSGARNTDPSRQMPDIGARLGAADITALSQYYASLAPPSPAQLLARAPPSAGPPPAPAAGASEPVKGVGVDQGAPTTGGGQGPGGGGGASGGEAQGAPGNKR